MTADNDNYENQFREIF